MLNSWTPTSTVDAPSPRTSGPAVWTVDEMIVWGGYDGTNYLDTGARYDPLSNSWASIPTVDAPSPRTDHTAVWTESEMVICGRHNSWVYASAGGRYEPDGNQWTEVSPVNVPSGRAYHSAVRTGRRMVVWGGYDLESTGGRYDPVKAEWAATSLTDVPTGRYLHSAIWNGSRMIIWGGYGFPCSSCNYHLEAGGLYEPVSDTWTAASTAGTPTGRYGQGTAWTGSQMIVWGGITFGYSGNGGRYCAPPGTIYYYDADADGQGDPEGAVPSCQQPLDFVDNAGDCNDSDGNVWSPPSEARDLLFSG